MKLIAFSGPRGSGKTVTSKIIKDILHDTCSVYHLSFADFLRDWLLENFGEDFVSSTKDRSKKDIPINNTIHFTVKNQDIYTECSPRDIMISAGNFLNSINPNLFCEVLNDKLKKIDSLNNENDLVVIDDLRFRNEGLWFSELPYQSTLVMIHRLDLPPSNELIHDFLDYEDAEIVYSTFFYKDPENSIECREGIKNLLETIGILDE